MPSDEELKAKLKVSIDAQKKLRSQQARATEDTEIEGEEIARIPLLTEPEDAG